MAKMPGLYAYQQTIGMNPPVAEAPLPRNPTISDRAVVGPRSVVIGDVRVADDVFIGFHNVIRADASPPFIIGAKTNLQDYVMIHCHPGQFVEVNGVRLGVYIEGEVSVLHHAAVHGPVTVGRHTFIGQHVSIYDARIGSRCVIMHGAVITNGVVIPDGRFVAPGQSVWQQADADALPPVPEKFRGLNAQVVDYYFRLGKAYRSYTPFMI